MHKHLETNIVGYLNVVHIFQKYFLHLDVKTIKFFNASNEFPRFMSNNVSLSHIFKVPLKQSRKVELFDAVLRECRLVEPIINRNTTRIIFSKL